MSIPLVSLGSSSPSDLAKAVSAACTSSGFLYITDHGISQSDIDQAFDISRAFFEDEQEEEKRKVAAEGINIGWTVLRQETLDPSKGQKGDLHESFYLAKFGEDGRPQQPLPPTLAQKQDALNAFFQQCHQLSLRLLEYFALSLSLPQDHFTPLHPATLDRLRFLHYPPFTPDPSEQDARSGSHSDYGSLTLLFQKDVGGLEVFLPKDETSLSTDVNAGEWTKAPIVEGALVCNIGDVMEAWTRGRFRSTLHRVPLPEQISPRRYSIAYFVQPADEVVLEGLGDGQGGLTDEQWREVLRSKNLLSETGEVEVLTAGEHLRRRLASTYKS